MIELTDKEREKMNICITKQKYSQKLRWKLYGRSGKLSQTDILHIDYLIKNKIISILSYY